MEKTLVESLMALSNRGFLDAGKSIAEFVRWSFWKGNQKLQLVCTIWQNLSRSLFSFSVILLKFCTNCQNLCRLFFRVISFKLYLVKSRTFPARYAILKYRKNAEDTSLSQNYSFTGNYFFITVTIVIWLLVRLLFFAKFSNKLNRLLIEKLNGQSGTWTFSFVINVILSRIDIRKLYWPVTYLCIRVVLARRWHSVEHKSSCCGGRIWCIGCERWKSWQSRFTVLQKWSFKRLQKKTKISAWQTFHYNFGIHKKKSMKQTVRRNTEVD